ncbi:MAG: GNAT family N-acetyltransferase [Promethearchaeota archaeon]
MRYDIEILEEIAEKPLILRKIKKKDLHFFQESLKDKQVTRYLSMGPVFSKERIKKLIHEYIKEWNKGHQFNYIIELAKEEIKRIGLVNLWNISWHHRRAEIGIWVIPNYQNKGYGTRALELVKLIAFQHLKLHRLEAHVATKNEISLKLFKKSGFVEEGVLRHYLNLRGIFHDAVVLSFLNEEAMP